MIHTVRPFIKLFALTLIALGAVATTLLLLSQRANAVPAQVSLAISKGDEPDPVPAGEQLQYTIHITNSGHDTATAVTVVENYDPNVSFVHASPLPDVGDNQWNIGMLAVGESRTIWIVVQVASPLTVGTVLTNQATLDSAETLSTTAVETTTVESEVVFEINQLDNPDPVEAGNPLEYLIIYENTGTAPASGVVLTDTLPADVTFDSAGADCTYASLDHSVICSIGYLPVGDLRSITASVLVNSPLPNGTFLTNTVTIHSNEGASLSSIVTTVVSSAPDLAFGVTDQPDPVEAGAPLTYTLRYSNTGNADATQVVVTATLDSNTAFSSATPDPTGGNANVWFWEIDNIPGAGGYGEIVIHTNVTLPLTNGTMLDFAAQLVDVEGNLLEDTTQTTVTSAPALFLEKNDGVSTVYAGDLLTYTLTYTNSGNENAYNVTITDTLPNHVEYVDCEIADGNCQYAPPDKVIFIPGPIIAQTGGQARLVMTVDDPLPAGATVVTNHARMTAPSLPAPIDVQDVDHIGTLPDLTVAAAHEPSLFSPGKLMTYTVTYGNAGHMNAENVIITTTLPLSTTYVGYGWDPSGGQTYVYLVGDLPAGDTDRTVRFAVEYPNWPQIGAPEFNTPFTITESGSNGGDANPDDNTTHEYIGVPDLVVTDFTVEPSPLQPGQPVTFTVTVKNQGTGIAWNPDNQGGFYVDIFTAPVASYPWERYSDIYGGVPTLAPGLQYTLVITHSGFSQQEIEREIQGFFPKVDNHHLYPYGLVPEHDEMNNTWHPPMPYRVYLPLVGRRMRRVVGPYRVYLPIIQR